MYCLERMQGQTVTHRLSQTHAGPRPGRRRAWSCKAFWKKGSSSSDGPDSDNGKQEPLPLVIPDVVPPPPRGNQYVRQRQEATYDTDSGGIGGRGGGVFSAFSRGGRGWSGGGPLTNFWQRLRLMALYFLWACSMYLILSSAFKVLRWVDDRLQISALLGFSPGQRLQTKGVEDETDALVELGGVMTTVETTTDPDGHTQAAWTATGAVLGAVAADAAAPEHAVATAAAEVATAQKMDRETQEHLEALKRYQARREGLTTRDGQGGRDLGTSATMAYFMTLATLAFFFVAL